MDRHTLISTLFPYTTLFRSKGWQFWPIVGREHKDITTKTNEWGDKNVVGGHDRLFVLWPFYVRAADGIGTENPTDRKSTRLNSSHLGISYAVFCLKKKTKKY